MLIPIQRGLYSCACYVDLFWSYKDRYIFWLFFFVVFFFTFNFKLGLKREVSNLTEFKHFIFVEDGYGEITGEVDFYY